MDAKTVLLIEDDPNDILLIKKSFEESVIENKLIAYSDGQSALDYLWGLPTEKLPVLILLDLSMTGLHGFEVLRQLKDNEHTHSIPVVILTASRYKADIDFSIELGANGYVSKPVAFEEFKDVVATVGLYWYKKDKTIKDIAIFIKEKVIS